MSDEECSKGNRYFNAHLRTGVLTRSQSSVFQNSSTNLSPNTVEVDLEETGITEGGTNCVQGSTGPIVVQRSDLANRDKMDRTPLIVPGKFRGDPEENVVEYLSKFERAAKANNWDEARKTVILPCYLEGAALQWFENLERTIGSNALTWTTVSNGMKSAFQTIALEEQLEFKLRMRMQRDEESVESYIQDVLNLCLRIDPNMTERARIKYVLRGLVPSLLEKVMLMENETIDQLVSNIRKLQTARYLAGQRVDQVLGHVTQSARNVAIPSTTPIPSTSLESQVAALTSAFNQLNMKLLEDTKRETTSQTLGQRRSYSGEPRGEHQGRGRVDQPHPSWVQHQGRGRGGSYRGRGGRTSDGRVICYNCGRVGHYAVACRAPRGPQHNHHNQQGNERRER